MTTRNKSQPMFLRPSYFGNSFRWHRAELLYSTLTARRLGNQLFKILLPCVNFQIPRFMVRQASSIAWSKLQFSTQYGPFTTPQASVVLCLHLHIDCSWYRTWAMIITRTRVVVLGLDWESLVGAIMFCRDLRNAAWNATVVGWNN